MPRILVGECELFAQLLLGSREVEPAHQLAGTRQPSPLRHGTHRARTRTICKTPDSRHSHPDGHPAAAVPKRGGVGDAGGVRVCHPRVREWAKGCGAWGGTSWG
ncbi:hypothetical protein GCM10028775_67050 [Catellatospora paridis]